MTAYARLNEAWDVVEVQLGHVEPDDVGPHPPPPDDDGIYVRLTAPIDWSGRPSESSVMAWNDGAPAWRDMMSIADHRQRAMAGIDAAGEALRLAVISHMTQTTEYERAERHALEYRAAGYPDGEDANVPPGVASWAQARWRDGWTYRQAADDILATADRWYAVLDEIRALRLANKEDVRHAETPAAIAVICADMHADMRALAAQLQLTLTS